MSTTSSTFDLNDREQTWMRVIIEKIRALRFGTVQIKIHEAQVVVIESTEQTRFDLGARSTGTKT
jgi:hypothetical protein